VKKASKKQKNKKLALTAERHESRKDKGGIPMAKIKVVGVGGGGGNAITRMSEFFPRGVELIAINTDVQDLEQCKAKKKLYIGKQITRGLGAGMNPELGRQAAEENREDIAHALSGADLVFITAGFGGGTGSGATPVVAEIAQELGILTIAIVTKPFSFEGMHRAQIAQDATAKLKERVDTFITISNDKVFSMITKDTSLARAFEAIDEILKNAVLGITEVIMTPGVINVDFADVKAIVQNSGASIIGVGTASGKERAITAAAAALNSPLLEASIEGARGLLFSVSGRRDMTLNEVHEIAKQIAEQADPSAHIIFGTYYDRKLNKGQIKVTLIATGFGSSYAKNISLFSDFSFASKQDSRQSFVLQDEDDPPPQQKQKPPEEQKPLFAAEPLSSAQPAEESDEETAESVWDIPAFLRKKKKK
jgi:cell division protein FtsZ